MLATPLQGGEKEYELYSIAKKIGRIHCVLHVIQEYEEYGTYSIAI